MSFIHREINTLTNDMSIRQEPEVYRAMAIVKAALLWATDPEKYPRPLDLCYRRELPRDANPDRHVIAPLEGR